MHTMKRQTQATYVTMPTQTGSTPGRCSSKTVSNSEKGPREGQMGKFSAHSVTPLRDYVYLELEAFSIGGAEQRQLQPEFSSKECLRDFSESETEGVKMQLWGQVSGCLRAVTWSIY